MRNLDSYRCPRFVKEYASWQIRQCESNELMQEKFKESTRKSCEWAIRASNRGLITPDEAVKIIMEAPGYPAE